jgi:hypothetical protein
MKMLYHFLIGYNPTHFSPPFEHDFQVKIIELFGSAVHDVLQSKDDIKFFTNIAVNLSNVIPLTKASYLYDVANLELLKLNLSCLKRLTGLLKNNSFLMSISESDLKSVVGDLGNNARYLAFMCLYSATGTFPRSGHVPKLTILQVITAHLTLLFHPYIGNSNEGFIVSGNRFLGGNKGSMDDRSVQSSAQVFEALSGLTAGNSTGLSQRNKFGPITNLSQLRIDRNRISVFFAIFAIHYGYSHSLDEVLAVRTEAVRMIAFLSKNQRTLLEPVLGIPSQGKPRETVDLENDVFHNICKKLVPNAKGEYDLTLRGGSDLEADRFADFSFWVSDNTSLCDRVFRGVESSLNIMYPNFSGESDELLRILGLMPCAQDLWHFNHAENFRSEKERKENGLKSGERVARQLLAWRNDGIKGLTAGAFHWKQIWSKLRTTPLWGNDAINDTMSGNRSISWRVEYCQGPEKTRKKLLQDTSRHDSVLYGEKPSISNSNKQGIERTTKIQDNNDLELLLKEMNLKGILRKAATESDIDLAQELSIDELTAMQQLSSDDLTSNDDEMEDADIADVGEELQLETDSSARIRLESMDIQEESLTPVVSIESKKSARSLMLREVIKGIIPSHDLKNCVVYNIVR